MIAAAFESDPGANLCLSVTIQKNPIHVTVDTKKVVIVFMWRWDGDIAESGLVRRSFSWHKSLFSAQLLDQWPILGLIQEAIFYLS